MQVMFGEAAIEGNGLLDSRNEIHQGLPAEFTADLGDIGVVTADIDGLAALGKRHALDWRGAGGAGDRLRDFEQGKRWRAPHVEDVGSVQGRRTRPQESVHRVVDVKHVAQLAAVAEDL
jgi:hypothetical protein